MHASLFPGGQHRLTRSPVVGGTLTETCRGGLFRQPGVSFGPARKLCRAFKNVISEAVFLVMALSLADSTQIGLIGFR